MSELPPKSASIAELEAEIAGHQVVHQRLSNAKQSLDQELLRFRVIQQYVERAALAVTLKGFYQVTLEAIIEAFEFEVALFLRADGEGDHLAVVATFGFEHDMEGSTLPFDERWVGEAESRLLKPGSPVLDAWASLDLVDAVLCPWRNREGGLGGVLVGGKTGRMSGYYDVLSDKICPSFTVIVCQAAALLANQEFAADIRAHNESLRLLSNSYSRFVPFAFLKLLGRDSLLSVMPGDHVRLDMTVLYADLRGFTTLAEKLGAEGIFVILKDCVAAMEPSIVASGGFINHYQGDAITALFPYGADSALEAAKGMMLALGNYNANRALQGEASLRVGIGINYGELMLGAIGSAGRLDVNVVGDTVNLTARTEGLNKLFGSTCMVTELTVEKLKHPERFALRELDRVVVAGRSDPVVVHELLDCDPPATHQLKVEGAEAFARGLDLYRKGAFALAIGMFAEVTARHPQDSAAALYVQRCAELLRKAPSPGWNGITVLDHK